ATLNVTVTANSAPTLTYSNQSVASGGALNVTPTTASDNGSITGYSVVSVTPALTTAPTVNVSGLVAITSANPSGLHTITIRATDNCGATTDASFTVNVGCPTITLSPATLPGGTAGANYNQAITASGGTGSYNFTVSAGALPSGLSLSPGGALSGTPTAGGTFNFTVTATDANGCTGLQAYTLAINCSPFTINPTTQSFAANGGTGSVTVTGAAGCAWTGVSNDAWIIITSGSSGSGSGTVNYSVAANTGALRSGTVTIAGQTFTVTQSAAGAVAGNLDPTFGGGGKVTNDLPNIQDQAYAMVIQPDGKIVLAGRTGNPGDNISGDFALARYNSGGTLDASFGNGGVVSTPIFGSGTDIAYALALQADGKLIAAGSSRSSTSIEQFALVRYNANGTLDTGFGAGGKVTTNRSTGGVARAIVIRSDGKIIIGGTYNQSSCCKNFVLGYFNSNGSLDTSAGTGGFVETDFSQDEAIQALVLQPDGKLVAIGHSGSSITYFFALARYNSDGSLDTSFGTGGKVLTDISGGTIDQAYAAALQPDGKIVAAGYTSNNFGTASFALARYNGNGSPDTGFGTNGQLTTPFTGGSVVYGVAAQLDGKLVAAGYTTNAASGYDFALARYNSNGSLDTAFGPNDNGKVTTDFFGVPTASGGDRAYAIGLQNDGKIVAAGYATSTNLVLGDEFALARYEGGGSCGPIALAPPALPDGAINTAYNQTLTASGGAVPYGFSIVSGNLPAGLSLASGGVLAGTPAAVGVFNFVVKATDANGCQGSQSYTLAINCPTITINPATIPGAIIGQLYSQSFTQTGGIGAVTFSLTGTLPPGLSFNAATATISGTPTQVNSFSVTIKATDGNGCQGMRTYSLPVNCPALGFNPATLPGGTAGVAYSQAITVTGGGLPFTFTVSQGALPPGLTLSMAGVISGIPTQANTFNFSITATDANNCGIAGGYQIVISPCPAVTITPALLPAGMAGFAYNQTLTASGGSGPYAFGISGGALPAGMGLSSNGVLSGTPLTFGAFNFIVQATGSGGCTGMQSYALAIAPPCNPIIISPATLPGGFVSTSYSQTLTAGGGTAPYSFAVTGGSLPGGLSLNSASGLLSGLPAATGTFNLTVTATDATGCTGSRAYTMIVSGNGLVFYPLPRPVRLLDTRAAQGNCDSVSAPIAAGASLTTLARVTCESITIPATAQAVAGNLTVLNQTAQTGYLTIYPTGQTVPLAANMVYGPGAILSNNFTVGLSGDGRFNVFGERTIDVVVDISGYYAPPQPMGLYYHTLPKPIRLLDTRSGEGNCDNVSTPIAAGASLTTLARTTCESLTIPTAAQAIVGNATVINASGQVGYLTIYPNGVAPPLAANMVYFPGQILSNAFTVSLSAGGEFNIFAERTIHMVVDVAGYYSNEAVDANGPGLLFTPLARPLRLMDTRAGEGNCDVVSVPITGGGSIAVPNWLTCESITIPNTARTVLGNVTVINLTPDAGYLTLYPDGVPQPLAANMVYFPGQILSNAFAVGVNTGTGQFRIFAERTLHSIVDVSGYFAP
ncbi:MAG: putative Ig domain-containing protein, partial [Acidobacteriota bacterium]